MGQVPLGDPRFGGELLKAQPLGLARGAQLVTNRNRKLILLSADVFLDHPCSDDGGLIPGPENGPMH